MLDEQAPKDGLHRGAYQLTCPQCGTRKIDLLFANGYRHDLQCAEGHAIRISIGEFPDGTIEFGIFTPYQDAERWCALEESLSEMDFDERDRMFGADALPPLPEG